MIPTYDLLTLHPDLLREPLAHSIIGRAVASGAIAIGVHDIRDHGTGRHRQCDDAPYGGGAGVVMKVDVVAQAIDAVRREDSIVILTTPAGVPFSQSLAQDLSTKPHIVVVCGHYEGLDARIESMVDLEISLGDFVMTGGEIAALAIVDATARLRQGVLGNEHSTSEESFQAGSLEYPQYTRPPEFRGMAVPDVLLSGDHAKIARWRAEQSILRTKARRPDLAGSPLNSVDDDSE
jgi:tRNA (guanine37-N1)-methyltransferase